MKPQEKTSSLSSLIKELDGHFSRFIRKRDTVDGKVICFLTGEKMDFIDAQCGHFIDRDQMPTRYDERNCHAVSEETNCYDPDHKEKYRAKMLQVYGLEEIERLERKSKGLQKFFKFEIEDLIEYYRSENRLYISSGLKEHGKIN